MAPDELAQAANSCVKHGVLVLHGAGMPEDEKDIIGDPLATIANGLIDVFNNGAFGAKYRLATTAQAQDQTLAELDLNLFCKDPILKTETLVHTIRMREVLWKPVARKSGLAAYIPLMWQWAFAFESNSVRKTEMDGRSRALRAKTDEQGKPTSAEKQSRDERHQKDFIARLLLAVLGFGMTCFWAFIASQGVKALNPSWTGTSPEFVTLWQITTSLISISFVSGVLLILLALGEWRNSSAKDSRGNPQSKPHSRNHMLAIIATSGWLAPFVLPLLILVYYFDRAVMLGILCALAAGALFTTLTIDSWQIRIALLLSIANVLWLAIQVFEPPLGKSLRRLRGNTQCFIVPFLTSLIVSCGAPVLIVVIRLLELFALLPIAGDAFQQAAKTISQAGFWEAIRDINMYLTDSSRSAVVRHEIEEGIVELAKNTDQVHILSHSLGTVVAYETLVQIGAGNSTVIIKNSDAYNKIKTLVTYGSPLNKVRILADKTKESKEVMSGLDYTRFCAGADLPTDFHSFHWMNFYSLQDLVSDALTRYAQPVPPSEYSLASADDILSAHGAYWTDAGFWNTILEELGLGVESKDLTRVEEVTTMNSKLAGNLRDQGIYTKGQLRVAIEDPEVQKKLIAQSKGKIKAEQLAKIEKEV
jgi:hypothetical protein